MTDKLTLRRELKRIRREHVASIPGFQLALLFRRPPQAVVDLIPDEATIGIYAEMPEEAPATRYGQWFSEQGHQIALPWFGSRTDRMQFRQWSNPFDPEELVADPFRSKQPTNDSPLVVPDVVFCPLLGFSSAGDRLGLGAGHFDRWLAENPPQLAIGLAWDCQQVDDLPLEPHDRPLDMVITPTRVYGPF